MTLPDWLYFLDTSSRVQCPEITAQQAAELAGLLREMERTERRHANEWADMHDACAQRDERVEILEAKVVFWKARALASSPVAIAAPDFDASDYERPGKVKP